MRRLLFIMPGLYFDPSWIQVRRKYELLSRRYDGAIISTVYRRDGRRQRYGRFALYGLYLPPRLETSAVTRHVLYTAYVLGVALYLAIAKGRFDVVVATDAFKTGVLATLIGRLTGARVLIDVVGNHARSFSLRTERVGLFGRLKHWLAVRLTPFVLNRAHGVKLLYQGQVAPFPGLVRSDKYVVFHDYAPVSLFESRGPREKYVLFIGSPWFLKGVDVLIEAFRRIADRFPEHTLRIYGYTPDRARFEALAAAHPRIELHGPVPYEQVIELMPRCALFVLPSRTEAMGRVLLEAMACRTPVVATRVDGVPTYVEHGRTGLLVEPDDVDELAAAMAAVLGDSALAGRLAENGHAQVHGQLSEEAYLARLDELIERVVFRPGPGQPAAADAGAA